MYFLMGFVVITLLTEINYLNKALELFNTVSRASKAEFREELTVGGTRPGGSDNDLLCHVHLRGFCFMTCRS